MINNETCRHAAQAESLSDGSNRIKVVVERAKLMERSDTPCPGKIWLLEEAVDVEDEVNRRSRCLSDEHR